MLLKGVDSPESEHGDPGVDQVQLGGGITVGKYRRLVSDRSREALAKFVHARFLERYVMPLEEVPRTRRSGFLIMAVCCLMIEALESFKQGWPDTKNLDGKPFKEFFSKDVYLKTCGMKAGAFWRHVRCGLLHQAETTGGWRILRKGPRVDAGARTINATSFLAHVRARLDEYRDELNQAGWDDEIWGNFRKKMYAICKNCERA